jgi:hypothetical protein
MNDSQTNIERIVMRRVRLIRILALIISTAMFAVLTFIAALWGIGREVWVARVLENMPSTSDFGALMSFLLAAFLHTRLIVQVLAVLTLTSLLFLASEIARTIVAYFTHKDSPTR